MRAERAPCYAQGERRGALRCSDSHERSRTRHVTCPVATYTACCSARWGGLETVVAMAGSPLRSGPAPTTEGPNVNLNATRLVSLMAPVIAAVLAAGCTRAPEPAPPAPGPAVAGTGGRSGTGGSKATGGSPAAPGGTGGS